MSDFKCEKCGRSFSMAAHLARHTNSAHGPGRGKIGPRKRTRRRKKMASRVGGVRREAIAAAQFNLSDMPFEDLGRLIQDARAEIRQRIAEIEQAI